MENEKYQQHFREKKRDNFNKGMKYFFIKPAYFRISCIFFKKNEWRFPEGARVFLFLWTDKQTGNTGIIMQKRGNCD